MILKQLKIGIFKIKMDYFYAYSIFLIRNNLIILYINMSVTITNKKICDFYIKYPKLSDLVVL